MLTFLVIGIVKTLRKHKKASTRQFVKLYIAGGLAFASAVLSILLLSLGGDTPLSRAIGMFWLLLCSVSGFFLIALGGFAQKKIQENPDYRLPKFYRIFPPYGNLFILSAFFAVSIMMVGAFSGLRILLAVFDFAAFGCMIAGLVMWIRSKVKTSDSDEENNCKKIAKHRRQTRQNEASALCAVCGKNMLKSEMVIIDEKFYCKECFREKQNRMENRA